MVVDSHRPVARIMSVGRAVGLVAGPSVIHSYVIIIAESVVSGGQNI